MKLNETVADLRGGEVGGPPPPPIDWMHLKNVENFAQKCIIFAYNSLPRPLSPPFRPPISKFWICRWNESFTSAVLEKFKV